MPRNRSAKAESGEAQAPGALPAHADLVVVGSGPHAAALVMRLLTKGELMTDPNPPIYGYRHTPSDVRKHLFKTPVDKQLLKSIVFIWAQRFVVKTRVPWVASRAKCCI